MARFEQRIPEETIDVAARRQQAGESLRSIARDIGMDSGGLSRRLKKRRERIAVERNEKRKTSLARRQRRSQVQRGGREPPEHAFESLAEMRALAAEADNSLDLRVEPLAEGESDQTSGSFGFGSRELPEGSVTPIWDYPRKGWVVLAADYDALFRVCRSDTRVHWFVNAALIAGELLPGEMDHRKGKVNHMRRVRFRDGGRRRAYCFLGSHEREHLVRLYRALLYDSRDPAKGIPPPPADEHGRILGVYRV